MKLVMGYSRIFSLKKWLAFFAAIGACNLCYGFAANGHHIVALICEQELTTHSRRVIKELLPTETLAEVSTWADAERERNRATAHWHYVDFNIATGKLEAEYAHQPNILDAISSNSTALRTVQSSETRQHALKFIVHFVADLHQPLHCADNNDAGGNRTQVLLNGEQSRLHRVWDGPIVDRMLGKRFPGKSLEEVASAIHAKYRHVRDTIGSATLENWARESFEIAKNHVYRLPPAPADGEPHQLNEEYLTKSEAIIEEQLAKAGFRLAHTLNTLLDPNYHAIPCAQNVGTISMMNRESTAAEEMPRHSSQGNQRLQPAGVP